MRERIILAPGLNGNELMRSLALHGVNCFGLRVCGAVELARIALMRTGISIAEDFISAKEETAIVAEAVIGEPYFDVTSFSDVQEITATIRRMRCLVAAGDETQELNRILSHGLFIEKNKALLRIYRKYMASLAVRKAIDAVSLIRKASQESAEINTEFLMLKEYPLNPLETALINRVSGGRMTETCLCALFGAKEGTLHIDSIKNCYGAPNEVETLIEDIYANRQLDQCTVAVADAASSAQLFFDYALLYGIPVTFGCGIPIINSNPARLTALYYNWITGGFFGADALDKLLSGESFNKSRLLDQLPEKQEGFCWSIFYDVLADLRLTNDSVTNDRRIAAFKEAVHKEAELKDKTSKDYKSIQKKILCIPSLEIVARELALPAEEFILKYAHLRKGSQSNSDRLVMMLDAAASRAIYEELKVVRSAGVAQKADDIIPNILSMRVCVQRSEAGKLHITGIDKALATARKHLYIVGLSASNYPGSPRENHLLLDADLKLFGQNAEPYTADGRILQKRRQLLTLARLTSALGSRIYVSYSGLNVSELKKDNPSSLVYELFREARGGSATSGELEQSIRKVDYFEPEISVSRLVGKAYTQGRRIMPGEPSEADVNSVHWNLEKAWSPTALEDFFRCPRRFMLGHILGIPEPTEYDPFEVVSAMDLGTLAHSLMEVLGRDYMDRDEFLSLSHEYFDNFLMEHPPLITENVQTERNRFLEMMETAYEMDPHREVILEEEDLSCTHESGIKIHGIPDRVEKLENGAYLVVDFKSGRQITHTEDDIGTCLQVIIYAYLMEQKGYKVSGGEYRYIRLGETIACRYDPDMKQQLMECLTQFRNCLENASFPTATPAEGGNDPCAYCRYQAFCGRDTE